MTTVRGEALQQRLTIRTQSGTCKTLQAHRQTGKKVCIMLLVSAVFLNPRWACMYQSHQQTSCLSVYW